VPILPEELDAAMTAVRAEILRRMPFCARVLTDADCLAIAAAAMKPLSTRVHRLESELKGLA
jgi:hypothetical protein